MRPLFDHSKREMFVATLGPHALRAALRVYIQSTLVYIRALEPGGARNNAVRLFQIAREMERRGMLNGNSTW